MIAVLIDTVSIQPYIFGSNKLKENIGASYILEHRLFKQLMLDVLKKQFSIDETLSLIWENEHDVKLSTEENIACEIGYMGGGNALVLFKEKNQATIFIKKFTLELLLIFPGIRTAFGVVDDFDPNQSGFKKSRKSLNDALIRNKTLNAVNVIPFKHGIVNDCALSNEGQETDFRALKNISEMSAGKLSGAVTSQKNLVIQYEAVLSNKYVFTDELEKLGQKEGKGYIAVVHVDGNGMGQRFIDCTDLPTLRKLSTGVSKLADTAMEQLISYVVSELFESKKLKKENGFELNYFTLDEKERKYASEHELLWEEQERRILPLRPIIVGGDDITFVCEGRLGVHLAEKLIEFMTNIEVDGKKISACGGVAVVHTKYPFYRAYQLSEELTKQAKESSRAINGSSWLSFLISSGGFSGSLKEVQAKMFDTPNGNLYNGPYRVDEADNIFEELKKNIGLVTTGEKKWPKSKLMALRDVLRKDEADRGYFLEEAKARTRELPPFNGKCYHKEIWKDGKTPYYDMIDLLEFYPKELL